MTQEGQLFQASFDLFSEDEVAYCDYPVTVEAAEQVEPEGDSAIPRAQKPEGYAVYIFTKNVPRRKKTRCYYIYYQPSLWDHYTVQRQWGMLGSEKQQFYTEHFESPRPALARIRHLIQHRLRRGYKLHYAA